MIFLSVAVKVTDSSLAEEALIKRLFENCRERPEFGPRSAVVREVRRASQGRNQVAQ